MKIMNIGMQNKDPFKKALGHIIETRRGYQEDIIKPHGEKMIDSFKTVGFIKTGHTLKSETYSATKLADMYYREMFGNFNWTYHRIKGIVKKIVNKG